MEFTTRILHSRAVQKEAEGATLPPIYQVSAFAAETPEDLEKVFQHKKSGHSYSRISNPTVDAFERRISELEGGKGAVATSSGMAAITMALLNILRSGDEVIAAKGLFGGTVDLFEDLAEFGITVRYADHIAVPDVEPMINERTRAIYGERIGNPLLDVMDVPGVAELAHAHGLPLIVDNTMATPYLSRPIEQGADIVVHSTSKYISGSGNSISGVLIDSGNFKWDPAKYPGLEKYRIFGKFAYLAKLRNGIYRNMGSCLSPFNAYLSVVGMETLGLRMERICRNAEEVAKAVHGRNGVKASHPTLPDSPYHAMAMEQLNGHGGGIVAIHAGSKERAHALMKSLTYATNATNIGDVRTLVLHPASTIFAFNTAEQKEASGVFEDTIRVSCGIEDTEDLVEDFVRAVDAL